MKLYEKLAKKPYKELTYEDRVEIDYFETAERMAYDALRNKKGDSPLKSFLRKAFPNTIKRKNGGI